MKANKAVAVAEYTGAALCIACEVPVPEPTIISFRGTEIFGSRLESGVELPQSFPDLLEQLRKCANKSVFSAILTLDLALGNCDRHWHNWLPQVQVDGSVVMRAVDFSRSWPTVHPPRTFESMRGENTEQCWSEWLTLGVALDQAVVSDVCSTISTLNAEWVDRFFQQLPVDWMLEVDGPSLIQWWDKHWVQRIADVENFLKSGAWT